MNKDDNKFIPSQTIKDNSGVDLNFINKVIFYNNEFEFLTCKDFKRKENYWELSFFEYNYTFSSMNSELLVKRPELTATIIPTVTVPTVVVNESDYSMYTYYIAKVINYESTNSQYNWLSSDKIMSHIKEKKFHSECIYNMRRFFELLLEHRTLLN